MSLVLRRTYYQAKNNLFLNINRSSPIKVLKTRKSDNNENNQDYSSSSILVENGYNVQELPVIVRKVKDLSILNQTDLPSKELNNLSDTNNFKIIQEEFKNCLTLRDIFSLLSKCSKITPFIALAAMERMYEMEQNPHDMDLITSSNNIVVAKDAIIVKLLKVLMSTDDTQTILNALNSASSFINPYKQKFCDEILLRVFDNNLSVDQICSFIQFLATNKDNLKTFDMVDKLWVGFVQRDHEINESNIITIFSLLPELQSSKKIVLNLVEQHFQELWCKIKLFGILKILDSYIINKLSSPQSFAVAAGWLHTNIHSLDEDSLLDMLTKFMKLNYNDEQIEKSIERYVKLRGLRIKSCMLIIGILNYCMQFQIRREHILNGCAEFFLQNGDQVPYSFIKFIVKPFGHLYYEPVKSTEFLKAIETMVIEHFTKMKQQDLVEIALAFVYLNKQPMMLINKIFTAKFISKIDTNEQVMETLKLVDTALSLEVKDYAGPRLPKVQWTKSTKSDSRLQILINKINTSLVSIAGGSNNISTSVYLPHLHSDQTYLIDVMIHPMGLGCDSLNWQSKSTKNKNVALLIHLPEHFCNNNINLIGPQEMRRRHLQLLGFKVISLKYSILMNKLYNKPDLEKYLLTSLND